MIHSIKIDIYENNGIFPIVTHIFRGKTSKEAWQYVHAHMETDSFLRSAVNYGVFKDIPLKVKTSYVVRSRK